MISMRKLARLAGVSTTTISRVLHNDPRVHPATCERILALVDQHHYLRNVLTQGVLTGRTRMIGVVLPSFHFDPYAHFLHGILEEAKLHGYYCNVAEGHHTLEHLREIIDRFLELRVEGIIIRPGVHTSLPRDLLLRAASYGTTVVGVDLYDTDYPVDQLCCDEEVWAELTLDYLVELGHRTIAFIGTIGKDHARGRARHLMSALKRRKLATELFIEAPTGLLPSALTRTILTDLMYRPTPPTAIIGWDDNVAAPLIQQARELDIAVPQRLSIIGSGDMSIAAVTSPPLTTVHFDFEQRGRQAVRLVITRQQQTGADPAQHACLFTPPRLIKRGSCGIASFR